jgi:hypothetical protein
MISTAYEYMIGVEDWQFESWNTNVSDDVKKFYLNYPTLHHWRYDVTHKLFSDGNN